MKTSITVLLLFNTLMTFAQRFEIVSAEYGGENIQVSGEVFIDVDNKSIALNIDGRDMAITKMTFKKGEIGELLCFKETIDAKQRFKFEPNKNRTGALVNVSHVMTYTLVQGFSNRRSEFIYHLIKKRK